MTDNHYLVINTGSSTLKYALFEEGSLRCLARHTESINSDNFDGVLEQVLAHAGRVRAVGHRIVHGGQIFDTGVVIDAAVMEKLRSLVPLAPLHQPYNLQGIDTVRERHPQLTQIGCFDTAFHRSQQRLNQLYAIPQRLTEAGVLRYGFHGLSYQHISAVLPTQCCKADRKVIVLHLGSGASGCALWQGKSVASSMGFTALEGLMMATRCGYLDPGAVLYLLEEYGLSVEEVNQLLYRQSGLLGVSGLSSDLRDLVSSDNVQAKLAIDLFCLYAARAVGSLMADLQGMDVLVFTAGIGENQPEIRTKICHKLAWTGINLDDTANLQAQTHIHSDRSKVEVLVLATNEELAIAKQMKSLCQTQNI